jgi:hypothetical protein
MKDTREISGLRTMLKNVNVEHSALLRSRDPEDKLARLIELRRQRSALMARIAELRQGHRLEAAAAVPHPQPLQAVLGRTLRAGVLPTLGVAITSAAATLQRYWPRAGAPEKAV